MKNPFAFLIIGLFFGTGIGFLWAASQGITLDGHAHDENMAGHDHSQMQAISMENDGSAPSITAILHPDAVSGWNLEIQTKNFTFSPETVNQDNTPNAGHAHIYVDGKKLARVYSPWFHISGLSRGEHTIAVELNANSHSPFVVDGEPVKVEMKVTAP